MKKIKELLVVFASFFATLAVGCSVGVKMADERIYITLENDAGYVYDNDTKSFTVEYGNSFAVPEAYVYDKTGNVMEDYYVDFSLYNENDEIIMTTDAYLTLGIGNYSIVFSAADSGSSAKDLKFSLTVEDPKAPELEITSLFVNAGIKGSEIKLPTFKAFDISGVKNSATKVKVTFGGNEIAVSDNQFTAENEGTYNYEVYLEDALGNSKNYVIPIEITERYTDDSVSGFTLMSLDKEDYVKSVRKLYGTSENVAYAFGETTPAAANGVTPSGTGLKVSAPDFSTSRFLFINNKKLNVYNDTVGNIVIRIYVDDLLEKLTVYSPDGNKVYYEFPYITQGWHELAFSARSAIGWYDDFSDFIISVYNEDEVNYYIDEIYYAEQWNDTVLEEGYVADFDEAGYLNIVSSNMYSRTQQLEVITAGTTGLGEADAAALAGANGGILKITQKSNLDGCNVSLCLPVETSRLVGLRIRMYFSESENLPANSRAGFSTNDGYTTGAWWADHYSGGQGRLEKGWKNYYFSGPYLLNKIKTADSDLITAFWFGAYDTEKLHTYYIDEIEAIYLDETVNTDIPGQFEFDEVNTEGVIADFSDERYVQNVIPSMMSSSKTSTNGVVKGYSYASFNDGEKDVYGLKVEPKGNYYGTYLSAEGVEYVLPETISVRNTDGTPKAGEIIIRAYFKTSFNANCAWGVRTETGAFSAYGVDAVPACAVSKVAAGWNEFRISVKSLIMAGAKGISAVEFLTWYDPAKTGVSEYYIGSITFNEYIPPYSDPDYMKEQADGTLLLASFDSEEYEKSVSVTSYGRLQPKEISIGQATIDDEVYGVLTLKPAENGYNGFDFYLPKTLNLKPKRTPIGNYIYFRIYTPVDIENAFVNIGAIKEDGTYSDGGQYVKPQRIQKSLSAGWNTVKLGLKGFTDEGITNIAGLCVTVSPVYGSSVAEENKVLYVDEITIDKAYSAQNDPISLDRTVITAEKTGGNIVLTWSDVENATAYEYTLNGETVSASGNTYTIVNPAADTDIVFTVTAKNGEYSSVTSWILGANYGERTGDEFILAEFDREEYSSAFRPVDTEPKSGRTSLSEFYYDGGLIMRANGKFTTPEVKSGFVYYFPFAMDELRVLKVSVSNLKYTGSSESNWGIGQYSNAYIGVITESGARYNASKYTVVAGVSGGDYIYYYNAVEPVYSINIEALRAALAEEGTTLGKIVGIYYGQNKSAIFRINYIRYVDVLFLEAPSVTWKKEDGNYVVEWAEVDGAAEYEVTVDGIVTTEGVSGRTITLTSADKVVGVTAKASKGYYDSEESTVYLDPSYLTAKGTSYTYLSNFNNEGAEKQFRTVKIDYNGASTKGNSLAISHGTTSGAYTSAVTGVKLTSGGTWTFEAAEYVLPAALDLSQINGYLFLKLYSANWGNPTNLFVAVRIGDKILNVFKEAHYAVNDNYDSEAAALASEKRGCSVWSGEVGGGNYALILAWNVSELIRTEEWQAAFGNGTEIDGIIIGFAISNYTFNVDEIYFGNLPTLNEKYAFSATSGVPSGTSWSANGTGTATIVADEKATDGYALKITHNKTDTR